ncbi:TonB-linked SusC/RagA family outer membrane protein [Algoriphagus sp. 4150]|uniref:SusC/RagA family TonB-linked outer membrane protein n=1 Tax=Algoriphagus sp. 4150 TaxID=2817756 RepID=UPI00285F0D51|nr:TonB-dependent receptor [Algoriphagus sp. 4150]MDR7130059.1 TonB-linked SusC/RagA family outer membrane protein [Algoriphagus sp. 4150]
MKSKLYCLFLLYILSGGGLYAQHVLKGVVVGKTDKAPFPGATVIANGDTYKGTVTDANGEFTLNLTQESGEVTISFIGMETVTVPYQTSVLLTVELAEETSSLDEVVVIGYGTAKRSDLTTSVATLENVARTVDRPISSPQEMLQGQVAGVTVVSGSGDPGSTPSVIIRGRGTFNNEEPLYVVDGMPYYGSRINPNDIESMVVLKDAAAAAIYGAQAASGVIVITTKSGKSGAPRISLDFYQGWQSAYQTPQALNAAEYAQVYTQAALHAGATPNPAHDPNANPWGQVSRTNWMDEIFRTGAITNANLQLSGGSDRARYSTSFGYHKKEGLLLNTDYELFSLRLKGDYEITDKFRVGQNVYLNHSAAYGANTGSSYSGAIINAIYMNPAAPVYDEQGQFHGTVPFELSQFAGAYGDTYNPVSLLLRPTRKAPRLNVNAITYAEYDILEDLTFKSSFSLDLWNWSDRTFSPRAPEIGRPSNMNYLDQSAGNSTRWIWDQQLNYNKRFGKHNLGLTAVYSAQFRKEESHSFRVQDFDREDYWFQYPGNANTILNVPSYTAFEDALTSAIGRATYDFDDRYFIMGSIRRDQTSRLAPSKRTDFFPAVSGAWKISSESFFQSNLIDLLKLRASWGQVGNISSVGYYAFNVPLSAGNNVILGEPGVRNRHVSLNEMTNPNLKWERSETLNFGLDAALLRNKLQFTAEYYEKYTRGLILRNSPDPHSGVPTGALSNVGTVSNKGLEMSLSYTGNVGELTYQVGGNFSTIKNELVDLDEFTNDFIQHGDNIRASVYPFRSEPGQPLYSYHLIPNTGIFQNQEQIDSYLSSDGEKIQPNARPGDLIFQDVNGDGRISDADRIFMGNAMPDFTYGINISLEYKRFDLMLFGQGVSGVKLFNGYKHTTYNAGLQGYNLDRRVLDAWTPQNPNTSIPVLSTQDPNGNFGTASDWYLESGDYFRIKNVSLGYTFALDQWKSGSQVRLYGSAENLVTITKYSGLDPEVGSGTVIDNGVFPSPRTFTIGFNMNF